MYALDKIEVFSLKKKKNFSLNAKFGTKIK